MKIIVAIIASNNIEHIEFKNVWLKNIQIIKNDPFYSKLFEFYFLYDNQQQNKRQQQILYNTEYTDYYYNTNISSISESIFTRILAMINLY